jgi:hypothetical protein
MSYSKPKQISTGALELNRTLLKETLKDGDQQEANRQARNTQNISALVNTGLSLATQSIAPKADALSELNKDYSKQTQRLYNKVGSSDYDTGFEGTDKKADVFMNGLIDDYYRIKNSIKDMKDPSLGQQDLATIENMVNQYGEGVVNIRAFNSEIQAASKADINSGKKLSNTGAPAAQLQIIRKISAGGPEAEDIEFRREGSNILLYDKTSKQTLNITEFNRAQKAGEQYLKFAIPTEETTSGFFKQKIENKSEGGTFLEKYTTKTDEGGYKMTTQQQEDYKNDIMGKEPGSEYATGGMFEGLLTGDGNVAESIWEDQMFESGATKDLGQWPTGEEDGSVYSGKTSDEIIAAAKRPNATQEEKELYKLFYKDYYEPALNFLADQSLQGANELQITLDEEQEENTQGQKQEEEIVNNEQTGAGGIEVNDNKTGNTEVIKEETVVVEEDKKGVNKALKTDVGDGNDYIRKMFNYENTSGNSSGGGVGNYGFTGSGDKGAALKKLYDKAEGSSEEKGIKVVNEYIIGTSPDQKAGDYGTTILADLGMDRKTYDELPENIKEQLVDWKFNTGRGSTDLIAIASGIEIDGEKWDGTKAFENNSPTTDQIKDVDYSKLTPTALYDARQELYKKRIEGMEKMLKEDPDNEKLKKGLKYAKDGYNNSQINRLKVKESNGDTSEGVSLNQEADEIFNDDKKDEKEKASSYTTLMKPEEIKVVDSFSVVNTGENKANILRDGKPITSNKNGVTVTGLRAEGNNVVVDANILGLKGTGDLGSFKIEGNKVIFNEGSDYNKLEGKDKVDFDTFKRAMELDINYALEIQKQIKGEA